jgi:hypothetical protein
MMVQTSPDLEGEPVTTLHIAFPMLDEQQEGQFRDDYSVVSK